MRERETLREHKYVAAQMDRYDPQAEDALFAFHDERVVARVGEMTGLPGLHRVLNLLYYVSPCRGSTAVCGRRSASCARRASSKPTHLYEKPGEH